MACVLSAGGADASEVERNVPVAMRDGVTLRADVYRPDGPGAYPVLMVRTPYGKQGIKPEAYVKAGYIVVTQDARGRHQSEGRYESFYRQDTHDAADGYDTVEWAAKLPGSTGKVGTFGASYNAFLQWRLAPLRPPALVAMAASSIPTRLTQLEGARHDSSRTALVLVVCRHVAGFAVAIRCARSQNQSRSPEALEGGRGPAAALFFAVAGFARQHF
ncbi:MAG: CocE/NonD family hydrolase [Verrucomicrobiota bacterium]|nr:CocE/NonD family hydrolase [Verrucomicrobiota bacterium]